MKFNIQLKDAEEFLRLLRRAKNLSKELEGTLQSINTLSYTSEPGIIEFLDTSEGSVNDDILKDVTSKLKLGLEKLS